MKTFFVGLLLSLAWPLVADVPFEDQLITPPKITDKPIVLPCNECMGTGIVYRYHTALNRKLNVKSVDMDAAEVLQRKCPTCNGRKEVSRRPTLAEKVQLYKTQQMEFQLENLRKGNHPIANAFLPAEIFNQLTDQAFVDLARLHPHPCKHCYGFGRLVCKRCDGQGKIEKKQHAKKESPLFADELDFILCKTCAAHGNVPCERCEGVGISPICKRCSGLGLTTRKKRNVATIERCRSCKGTGHK